MRVLIVGYGNQGRKRHAHLGDKVVAIVDPFTKEASHTSIESVPLSHFDVAIVAVPDTDKIAILTYLLSEGKPCLVEKPLLFPDRHSRETLSRLAEQTLCYVAYNHRFEPHIQRAKALLEEGHLRKPYIYRLFYGNGTAQSVAKSPWRDKGLGVISDLGSHLLDLLVYFDETWLKRDCPVLSHNRFENKAPDWGILHAKGQPEALLNVSLLSFKNTFTLDIWCEKGSIHVDGLCKWGPSHLRCRERQYPSGVPKETLSTLLEADSSFEHEYQHFLRQIELGPLRLDKDLWIAKQLCEHMNPL